MSEETHVRGILPKKQPSKLRKAIWRLIKVALFLAIFFYVILTVLTNLGGSSETLRSAIEDLVSEKTGYSAHITTLKEMSFFPDIGIDVENVELRTSPQSEAVITLAEASIAFGFFDLVFGDKQIKVFDVQNLNASPGALLEDPVQVQYASLKDDEEKGARLEFEGTLGARPFAGQIGFEVEGSSTNKKYSVPDKRPIEISLGDMSASALSSDKGLSGVFLKDLEVSYKKQKAISGELIVENDGFKDWSFGGRLILHPNETVLEPEINVVLEDGVAITGSVQSERLVIGDFNAGQPLMALFAAGPKNQKGSTSFVGKEIDLMLDIKALYAGAIRLGALKAPVKLKDQTLDIAPLDGDLSGGQIEGQLSIVEKAEEQDTLKADIKVKNLDYGALQKQFMENASIDGKGNLALSLSAKAKNIDGLSRALKGKLSFVSGTAKMESSLLNVWGGGLLNALLPSFDEKQDMNVSCAVADFKIDKGLAETNALFVDTETVTLTGEGVYRYLEDQLDLKLTPQAKEVALGDLGAAVNVTGPLSDLSVTPSAMDISKKIGGLLLGAVNPAFYAVTLVDLGLKEDHPCKSFMIEKESLPPPEPKKETTEPQAPEVNE